MRIKTKKGRWQHDPQQNTPYVVKKEVTWPERWWPGVQSSSLFSCHFLKPQLLQNRSWGPHMSKRHLGISSRSQMVLAKTPKTSFSQKDWHSWIGLFDRRKDWRKQTVSIRFWWLTPCTLQTHLLLTQRTHTHIICFPNTPTHTFAHRAARHWVFLNTVLLGSLLYNQCLRDIQCLSHLFNVTVGNFCPHPGTTHYCPSTGRKHACGENITLYLHCTL